MRLSLCVCHTVFTRMESCLCTRWARSQRVSTPATPPTRRETWLAWPKWRSKVSSCWRLSIRRPAPSGCAVSLVVSVTLNFCFTPLTSFFGAITENELAAESSWRSQYRERPREFWRLLLGDPFSPNKTLPNVCSLNSGQVHVKYAHIQYRWITPTQFCRIQRGI